MRHCCCCKKGSDYPIKIIAKLREAGHTFVWKGTGEIRDRWGLFGKKIQEKQLKIGYIGNTFYPVLYYRWRKI